MSPPLLSIFVTIGIMILFLHQVEMSVIRQCTPCTPEECERNPSTACPWGEGRDPCGRRICARGPGDRCGGLRNVHGECGEGLMCRSTDERCHGCSLITLDCYNQNS